MRKLGVLLVVSILLFVFGCGTFVYELSQISPNQIDLSQEKTENLRFSILLILFILLLLQVELITNNYKTYKNG